MLIDTHQHLIFPGQFNYEWTEKLPELQDSFSPSRYREELNGLPVERSIFMEVDVPEARQLDEVRHVHSLCGDPENRIAGIIASGRPENPGFEAYLDKLSAFPVVGIRRVLHVVPDAVSQATQFRENVARLGERNLAYDVCVRSDQLAIAQELVASCPETTCILDHCGNPKIGEGEWDTWHKPLKALSKHPNLNCKLSGIIVQIGNKQPDGETIFPYLDACLELFGPERLVWGSDWPVCRLTTTLDQWVNLFLQWMKTRLTEDEQTAVGKDNATRIYNI
jgi:predicted TIM-barrel fold metal-dependent hydrolase